MRKAPQQTRSQETVAAIVTAAAHVLAKTGWAGFTTNSVAERAGVSIGSLYQYFPNKSALIFEIKRRHFADLQAVIEQACDVGAALSLHERVERLVLGMIDAHTIDPALHRILEHEVPHETTAPELESPYAAMQHQLRTLIRLSDVPKANRDIVAHLLLSALEGAVHGASRSGILQTPKFAHELTRLVFSYLSSRRAGPARATCAPSARRQTP
jgi:AcrR family transcriptional regulator